MINFMFVELPKLPAEDRILIYFDVNQDEALSINDASEKFGISMSQATRVMRDLAGRGLLTMHKEKISNRQNINVYERAT